MSFYDRMFNTIQHLEDRAITCESDVETDCLIEIANAIERAFGIESELHA